MRDNRPAATKSDVEMIMPPNNLKRKVGKAEVDIEALARAERAVAALADDYLRSVQNDIVRLVSAYEKAQADESQRDAHLQMLFQVSHDIKGQGATFGYPLLTQIGSFLCHYIEAGASDLRVISAHVDALRAIVAARMTGDGGVAGRTLISQLERLNAN